MAQTREPRDYVIFAGKSNDKWNLIGRHHSYIAEEYQVLYFNGGSE